MHSNSRKMTLFVLRPGNCKDRKYIQLAVSERQIKSFFLNLNAFLFGIAMPDILMFWTESAISLVPHI
jgi:hypothetical protein